ncbi:hypothetical protein B0T25DRAFT_1479 [Lasiosphaeria hispida]|uniref:Uncharacterized protein n=1 Tax=Lasiosphaeria hispida TaxID=260671 RepID=A0AAJ0HT92_9PEZI|nr:hypothetical protein B0T25DRAFT_1479 [Lasiosphaeria hispida]
MNMVTHGTKQMNHQMCRLFKRENFHVPFNPIPFLLSSQTSPSKPLPSQTSLKPIVLQPTQRTANKMSSASMTTPGLQSACRGPQSSSPSLRLLLSVVTYIICMHVYMNSSSPAGWAWGIPGTSLVLAFASLIKAWRSMSSILVRKAKHQEWAYRGATVSAIIVHLMSYFGATFLRAMYYWNALTKCGILFGDGVQL